MCLFWLICAACPIFLGGGWWRLAAAGSGWSGGEERRRPWLNKYWLSLMQMVPADSLVWSARKGRREGRRRRKDSFFLTAGIRHGRDQKQ